MRRADSIARKIFKIGTRENLIEISSGEFKETKFK